MAKFEAHLTFHISHAVAVKGFADANPDSAIKYSAIDGDALMGDKPYCYLTSYDSDGDRLLRRCQAVSTVLEMIASVPTLRTKVEQIVYDSKTGVNELCA